MRILPRARQNHGCVCVVSDSVYACLYVCEKNTFPRSLDRMIVRRCRKHTYVQLPPGSFFLTPPTRSFFYLSRSPVPRFTRVSVECDDSDRGSVQGVGCEKLI